MTKSLGLPPARRAALDALALTLPESGPGRDVQAALDTVLAARRLDPRDRGLATELVYGCLRLRGRLDYILSRFLKNPAGVPEPVRRILTLAAYEILYLSKVPAYASVDWAVSAVREAAGKGLSGMANAVLRRLATAAESLDDPGFYRAGRSDEVTFLSRFYSCPDWIVSLWLGDHGPADTRLLLEGQLRAAPLGLRVNRTKPGAKALFDALSGLPGVALAAFPTLALPAGTDFSPAGMDLPSLLAQGLVSRQSAAAQLLLAGLDLADWPEPIFDACAGRGGKTLALAEAGKRVFAADVHPGRLSGLAGELTRLGLPAVPTFRASATRPPLRTAPGTILLDAPCSGLGVLSRRPDSKWRRLPEDLPGLARLQGAMLEAAYAALAPGGHLVYMTCTVNRAENEGVVDRLGRRHRRLNLVAETPARPDPVLGEVFYGAVLKKTG
ncbi:MAG: transcription antitermination factor NusB [Desulfovibrionaceae bacterium]